MLLHLLLLLRFGRLTAGSLLLLLMLLTHRSCCKIPVVKLVLLCWCSHRLDLAGCLLLLLLRIHRHQPLL